MTTMPAERRRLLLGGGVLAATLALYVSLPNADGATAPEATAIQARTPEADPAADPPAAAPAAPVDLSAFRLHGLTATGAIIASAGRQRLVRLGREVAPGVTLQSVRQHHAVLVTSAGLFDLGFLGVAEAAAPPSTIMAAAAEPASVRPQARRTEVLQYRFGLAPRRSGGRIDGFIVRPGAEMPLLQRAGLRPGDVLIGVNGQTFDSDEKVMELASEIAGSYTTQFEFERNGQKMRASLPVNPRT